MVEINDIKNRESLQAWLEIQPRKTSVAIAHRAAMRLLPTYWDWVLTSEYALEHDLTVLEISRCNLISGVATPQISAEVKAATVTAAAAGATATATASAFNRMPPVNGIPPSYSEHVPPSATVMKNLGLASPTQIIARFASAAAVSSASTATSAVAAASASASAVAAASASVAAASPTPVIWRIIRADCLDLVEGGPLDQVALWRDEQNPYTDVWVQIKTRLQDDPIDWSFWIKWYEASLNGEPLNYDMLEKIALINPKDWEQGPEHVNAIIAGIEVEFDLKAQIEVLEEKLRDVPSQMRGMGDNQGPPLVEPPIAQEVLIIWEPLQELKQEIEAVSPNKERVLEIGKKLGDLAVVITKWIAGKVDKFVNAFVIASGTAAAGLALAWYTSEGVAIASLLSGISELVAKWAN